MKNTNSYQPLARLFQASTHWTKFLCQAAFVAAFAFVLPNQAQAQTVGNQLANPGMETGDFTGWIAYNAGQSWATLIDSPTDGNTYGQANKNPGVAHSGTYSLYTIGDYQGTEEYDGIYQDSTNVSVGDIFSADGWGYSYGNDWFAGFGSQAWIEVTFRDVTKNQILALYRSAVTWPADGWVHLQVTNQYDLTTYLVTNTVTNLVAPSGTGDVRYQVVYHQINYSGGSAMWDDFNLDFLSLPVGPVPPRMSVVNPSGVTLCTNTALTCTATADATHGNTISSIQIISTTSALGSLISTTVTNTYTTNSSVVSGFGTLTASVKLPLTTNTVYKSVTVTATDNLGGKTSAIARTFDTLAPKLVIEASDFNFSSGGFIDTPANGGLALYTNQIGEQNVDENKNPANGNQGDKSYYRTNDPVIIGVANPSTMIEQKFVTAAANGDTTDVEVEVGYNGVGDWLDYTRTYGTGGSAPAGTYNVWLYMTTDDTGIQSSLSQITSDPTQANQSSTFLGSFGTASFSMTDSSWSAYQYVPLVDQFGNLVSITLTNGQQTLRNTVVGNPNIGFYMLMPVTPVLTPVLQYSYPDGLNLFEATNHLTFTVGPANGSNIASSGVHLVVNGVDVTSQSGFTLTQVGNSWAASYPIQSNAVYAVVINVTNSAGLFSTFPINFDTFNANNFQWEASDYDFSVNGVGAQFIDNSVPTADTTDNATGGNQILATNSYYGYPGDQPGVAIAQQGVDINFNTGVAGIQAFYRADGVGDSSATDLLRPKFKAAQIEFSDPLICPFSIGWFNGGDWLNYTRTYPTNTFNVWGRLAGGAAFSGTSLCIVTNGAGTSTQATNVLGTFSDPNASGWQAYHWLPLLDTNGNKVAISLGGVATLKLVSGSGLNAESFMLVVAPLHFTVTPTLVGGQLKLSFQTQVGHTYNVFYSSSLTAAHWTSVGSVAGDGTIQTVTESMSGAQGYYTVSAQ
jgi:hypothetical protein